MNCAPTDIDEERERETNRPNTVETHHTTLASQFEERFSKVSLNLYVRLHELIMEAKVHIPLL